VPRILSAVGTEDLTEVFAEVFAVKALLTAGRPWSTALLRRAGGVPSTREAEMSFGQDVAAARTDGVGAPGRTAP
jgi:hypothetical protein